MSLPFLLEIGVEEIPDWMIPGALENLRSLFEETLSGAGLTARSVNIDATPRRLVLRADGLPEGQSDSEELVSGPPKSAPPAAVAGFAKKQGIAVESLALQSTPKGEYYCYTKKIQGRPVRDILAEALSDIILKIYFPKTMYWTGKTGPRFIRPIRWIVALLGREVVPFELAGVRSGLASSGHRILWETDQRKKLADRLPDLANVTFQAKLGSYLAKTDRVTDLVRKIGGDEHAIQAAKLSKCDLTTELVKEFTELQGVIGGLYARAQGEPEEVAQAIYDHYKPVSMEDSIPTTPAGQLVSLADKLDTLRGCFSIGMIPTGSRDPLALRRAAQGVVKILVEGKHPLSLSELLNKDSQIQEFVLDRVRYYFKEIRGFRYDEVNAVLASGWDDLVDVESRLTAVQAVRPTENFEPLAASFKRIRNILLQAGFAGGGLIDPELIEPGPEADLYADFERV